MRIFALCSIQGTWKQAHKHGMLLSLALILLTSPGLAAEQSAGLRWEGEQQILFTIDDLVRFDWERQVFELKRNAAMDLIVYLDRHLSRPFVVRDAEGIIYKGTMVSPESSMTYAGPVILTRLSIVEPPLFAIFESYHSKTSNERFHPRLRETLAKAGLLKSIPPTEKLPKIECLSTEWCGPRANWRIRAEVFPETFHLGETARVHLFFVQGDDPSPNFDAVELHSSLTQESGFGASIDHSIPEKITPETIRAGVYVLRYKPWGPVYGVVPNTASPGTAKVSFRLILRKSTPRGKESVYTVSTDPQAVSVLPKR